MNVQRWIQIWWWKFHNRIRIQQKDPHPDKQYWVKFFIIFFCQLFPKQPSFGSRSVFSNVETLWRQTGKKKIGKWTYFLIKGPLAAIYVTACGRLIKCRKLVLLVDLDQTLIHTTNDNIPPNIRDVYHFQLYGPRSPWYHTRYPILLS
jgi:hypothetical protein